MSACAMHVAVLRVATVNLNSLRAFLPVSVALVFFFNDPATTEIYTLSLHDALPISAKVEPGQYDLSRWRVAGIGGEMVRASVLEAFAERYADCGFDARAFVPSYGLAESTLAISFSPLGEGVKEIGRAYV